MPAGLAGGILRLEPAIQSQNLRAETQKLERVTPRSIWIPEIVWERVPDRRTSPCSDGDAVRPEDVDWWNEVSTSRHLLVVLFV